MSLIIAGLNTKTPMEPRAGGVGVGDLFEANGTLYMRVNADPSLISEPLRKYTERVDVGSVILVVDITDGTMGIIAASCPITPIKGLLQLEPEA